MTEKEFAQTVKEMRTAQKSYFATRDTKWLKESKRLEKEVDIAVDEMINGPQPKYGNLFEGFDSRRSEQVRKRL